jgi:hypothetical protein
VNQASIDQNRQLHGKPYTARATSSKRSDRNLSTAAVVQDAVGAATARAGDGTSGGQGNEARRNVGAGDTLKSLQVEDDTSDMRGGHGGTR